MIGYRIADALLRGDTSTWKAAVFVVDADTRERALELTCEHRHRAQSTALDCARGLAIEQNGRK